MTNTPPPPPPPEWGGGESQPAAPSWSQPPPPQPAGTPGDFPPGPPPGWTQPAAGPLSQAARSWGWSAVAAAIVVAIAAFLVWARFPELGIDIKGIGGNDEGISEGTKDGALTLSLAIAAGILGAIRGFGRWALAAAIVILVCGAFTTIIALADIGDINDTKEAFGVAVDVGIGLWLTLVGGLALTAVGIIGIIKRR